MATVAAATAAAKEAERVFGKAFSNSPDFDPNCADYACITYGWMGSSPQMKYRGGAAGAKDAFNGCGAYTAIVVQCKSCMVMAEKTAPGASRADIDRLISFARSKF